MEDTLNVPKPTGKVVHFDHIKSFDEALDYARGGYHASIKKAEDGSPVGRLWKDAAMAYYSAHLAIEPLKALPGDQAIAKARELLHDANHKADQAAASKVTS